MPPKARGQSSDEGGRCCPHCDRSWSGSKSGRYKAMPDLDKLYVHFMQMQQVCSHALLFARNIKNKMRIQPEYNYLSELLNFKKVPNPNRRDNKKDAEDDAKKETPPMTTTSTTTTLELQTISIGNKTYRITKDVTVEQPQQPSSTKRKAEPEAKPVAAKKPKLNEGAATKSKLDAKKKDVGGGGDANLSDGELRKTLAAAMSGQETSDDSPHFELAKRMLKFVTNQMAEAEVKGKPSKNE